MSLPVFLPGRTVADAYQEANLPVASTGFMTRPPCSIFKPEGFALARDWTDRDAAEIPRTGGPEGIALWFEALGDPKRNIRCQAASIESPWTSILPRCVLGISSLAS